MSGTRRPNGGSTERLQFDLIIIGSGIAGLTAATTAAAAD